MIIDRNAGVTPNRYASARLRRAVGKRIGRASRDDMLRALLWVSEVRTAGDVTDAWRQLHQELDRELTEAERRRNQTSWKHSSQIAVACHEAAKTLAEELWCERQEAWEALQQCEDITQEFSMRLGVGCDLEEQPALPEARAALGALNDHLPPARQRFTKLLSDDRHELHRLAELEERKRQSRSRPGVTIEQLDAMEQQEFDDAVRQALEHTGLQVSSRGPRILEVSRDGAKGLVFCANTQRPARDETTHIRMIIAAQRLARTGDLARVLVISNDKYISRPAHRLCEEDTPSVVLVQRFELQRWIEWGIPLRNWLVSA